MTTISLDDAVGFLTEAILLFTALWTLGDFIRRRGRERATIALMFGSLGLTTIVSWTMALTGFTAQWPRSMSTLALLAHPVLMTLVIHQFRRVPRWIIGATLLGWAASSALWLLNLAASNAAPQTASVPLLVIVAYFGLGEAYPAYALVVGAIRSRGIVQRRLGFAAAGTGLLAFLFLLAGVNLLLPPSFQIPSFVTGFLGFAAIGAFYVGFSPPAWLRRLWLQAEIARFAVHLGGGGIPATRAARATNHLAKASLALVAGVGVQIVLDRPGGWQLRDQTGPKTAADEFAAAEAAAELGELGGLGQPKVLAPPSTIGPAVKRITAVGDHQALLVIPVDSESRRWGLVLVTLDRPPLFLDEAVQTLRVLAGQVAFVLEAEASSQSQQELAAIVETSQDAILSRDLGGIVQSWNRGAEGLSGYPATAVLGTLGTDWEPPDRRGETIDLLRRIAEGAKVIHTVSQRVTRSGALVDLAITVSPIQDAEGKTVGASFIERDVTDQKRAEATVRENEARFRAITESAQDGIVTSDDAGNIIHANPAAVRMLRRPVAELVGQPLTILMPERLQAGHLVGLNRFVSTREGRIMGKPVELVAVRSDGVEIPVEVALSHWEAGGRVFFTGMLRDISERKKVAAALEAANKELEAFAYSVSHDLRAPLRSMDGFSRILLESSGTQLSAKSRHYVDMIVESAGEMARLVDDLLAFSRLGNQAIRWEALDPEQQVRQALKELQPQVEGREVSLRVGPLPRSRGDHALFQQVWANLLSNAIKYTRPRKTAEIEVGWNPADGGSYFVRDNGVGFDMEYAHKLFGVFQRLHRAEDFEGTGVGLAIVHRVVTRHGGRVWAKAAVDQGATFSFTIPGGQDHA